ncbi:carboxypeptidase regulatory-like domain-containing protein [Candidatus Babeliales bacterium]|nr:carboxypeptidase regulatory-like domain-containing protein [Candidatus Babeliales bacterium]
MKIRVLFGVLVLLLVGVSCAYGFEDTVQRYPTGSWTDYWTYTTTSPIVVNDPDEYPTSNSLQARVVVTGQFQNQYSYLTMLDNIDLNYFTYTIREYNDYGDQWLALDIYYYDVSDVLLGTGQVFYTTGERTTSESDVGDMYELIKTATTISVYKNGVYQSNFILNSDIDYGYIVFRLNKRSEYSTGGTSYISLDDISTSSVVGMNEEWTEAPTYIDTSYAVQSMFSFPTAVYTLESKHIGTGTVVNTTTLPSNQGASDKPAGFVRWNRDDVYGSNWGLYHVQLFRDSTKMAETTFTYFDSTISGSVTFDQDSYSQGQTANIDYTITSADFASYTYYLKVMDVYGSVQDTYTLTAASGTESPTLTDYDSGIYYAILSRTNKASGVNEEFAYDYASVTETVYITGNVTEAVSGTNMQNVSIQYLQGSTYYNTTSAADGSYNVSDLSVSVSTTITANATYANDTNFGNNSYNLSTFSFTPLAAEIYNVDLILFDVNHTYDNASAYGLITDYIYNQPIESATVNIYNDTWSNSTTSTGTGYYVFHNLVANGTYSINATASGYIDSNDYEINTTTSNATRQDIGLSTLYTVTVIARDATSTAYLSDYTAYLDGAAQESVNGSVIFTDVEYGLHSISAVADGYYPAGTTPLIDEDTIVTLDLTTTPSEYYSPHRVKFILKSLFLTRYSDVETTVYIGATASGDAYKTGTTGTDGSVTFELTEDVQYTLTFIDDTQGIDETITLYPVDNEYTVYTGIGNLIDDLLNPDDEEQAITAIDVSVTKTIINDNTANITVNYNDIMDETSGLTLTLSQSIAGNTTNKTILSTVDLGTANNTAYNFTVTNYNGESYLIEIEATHTTHGAIYRMYGIQFENTDTLFGFTVEVVGWLAIIFLTWFALTATSITVQHTAIGVCALATAMIAIGWGSYISMSGLGLAWIMSLAANFAHAKEASA